MSTFLILCTKWNIYTLNFCTHFVHNLIMHYALNEYAQYVVNTIFLHCFCTLLCVRCISVPKKLMIIWRTAPLHHTAPMKSTKSAKFQAKCPIFWIFCFFLFSFLKFLNLIFFYFVFYFIFFFFFLFLWHALLCYFFIYLYYRL